MMRGFSLIREETRIRTMIGVAEWVRDPQYAGKIIIGAHVENMGTWLNVVIGKGTESDPRRKASLDHAHLTVLLESRHRGLGFYYVMHRKKRLGSGNVFHFAHGAARARSISYQTRSREQAKEHL